MIPEEPHTDNLLLPSFKDFKRSKRCYIYRNVKYINSLKNTLSLYLASDKINHISLSAPGSIAILGIHGWFPVKFIQKFVGEPSGTSIKFIEKMETAALLYFQKEHGINLNHDSFVKFELNGGGLIEHRIDKLYEQVVARSNELQHAKLVLICTHSQGTPVSVMLLKKLLDNDILNANNQKISILAMAGISHGPFPYLKSNLVVQYVESDPARELFELNNSKLPISQKYKNDIMSILSNGVKIVAVGSWCDQVVPLFSSTMHGFNHKNIYRAIYIEAADYSSDFLLYLIAFGLKLKNLGFDDHDLVIYLSEYIAGNVFGFGTQGHSTLYEEIQTYILLLRWTFFDDSCFGLRKHVIQEKENCKTYSKLNSYYLPWIFSQILADKDITGNRELSGDIKTLLSLYKDWDPQDKILKDLKYKLDPLKTKL